MVRDRSSRGRAPIAFVSDYVPRHCGIATFTHDICEAVALRGQAEHDVFAVATNDIPEGYPYPDRVRFEIRQSVQADYRLAAEFLNVNQVSTVCLQHEYGIFGGTCGSHILALLKRLRRPMVATLHTVLKEPNSDQLLVMKEVTRIASRVVVMSDLARKMLHDVYDVPTEKIAMIHHGIPDMPFIDPSFYKDQFGVEGKKVLLTFGLLSPGKGIEYAIEALPGILSKYPDVVYVILGATHPHVKRESGEEYRNGLVRLAGELGVKDSVIFQNRFVELSELCKFLEAADLYVTPYLNEAQVTSGSLAYALGAGKATISTPYWYAKEMLDDGRGRLVPFRDAQAIADQVIDLLDNETERHAMRKRAYTFCRQMLWKRVAQDYLDVFDEAGEAWLSSRHLVAVPRPAEGEDAPDKQDDELPEVDLRHLRTLTDDTGILQHATYTTPDRSHGYCTDDNARALIATVMHWDQTHDNDVLDLMQTYLAFLDDALDDKLGRFRNFMAYNRNWSEVIGSEDSHARALWGLGMGVALCPHESMVGLATQLFLRALPAAENFSSPRAWAFTIVSIHAYLRRYGGDSEVRRHRAVLTERLADHFTNHMTPDWPWCEDVVTYANAKLPHALLMSGKWLNQGEVIDIGKAALHWLLDVQTTDQNMLSIIGTNGWYARGQRKAGFDQQPIEAHALIDACIEAFRVTREKRWLTYARQAFNWFLGDNDLRTPLYDFTTGGCRDGLHSDRVNENQGAESTLAWLMSLLLMHDLQMEQTLGRLPADNSSEQRPVRRPIGPAQPVVTPEKVKKYASTDSDGE